MIEKIVLDHMTAALLTESIPVYLEVPEIPPAEYVLLEKTGGGRDNHLDRAQFAVQSISTSLYRAAEINELAKAAMDGLILEVEVFRSALNSDYNYTDTRTKKYRYQAVYDITYKEV